MERSSEIIPEKLFLMLMTPLTASQRDDKRGLLYFMFKRNCYIFRDTGRSL